MDNQELIDALLQIFMAKKAEAADNSYFPVAQPSFTPSPTRTPAPPTSTSVPATTFGPGGAYSPPGTQQTPGPTGTPTVTPDPYNARYPKREATPTGVAGVAPRSEESGYWTPNIMNSAGKRLPLDFNGLLERFGYGALNEPITVTPPAGGRDLSATRIGPFYWGPRYPEDTNATIYTTQLDKNAFIPGADSVGRIPAIAAETTRYVHPLQILAATAYDPERNNPFNTARTIWWNIIKALRDNAGPEQNEYGPYYYTTKPTFRPR